MSNEATKSELPARGPRVLVVDDDPQLARALAKALRYLGFDVTIADGGQSALGYLNAHRFDALVLDLRMPDMDGIDVLRHAASHPNFPRTILHSAYLDVPTTVEAMRAGATEVLQKPLSAADLAKRIRELIGRAPQVSGEISKAEALSGESADASLLLGDSPVMRQLRDAVRRVAKFRGLSVLVEGATGTGKELVAKTIHQLSSPHEPMVSVNCAAIPAELFESELFGHDAGAFTNARGARTGLLEEARAGTLFLDEVGELPSALQPKLLRVLEAREFRRVGGNKSRSFAARVISATNRRLADEAGEVFRSDLYFRISGHTLRMPLLRDHADDIPLLAVHLCREFCQQNHSPVPRIDDAAMTALCQFDWPGNVRQLRVVIGNAVVHASGNVIRREQIEQALGRPARGRTARPERPVSRPLPDVERDMILDAYREAGHNLSQAADILGIPRTTLRDRLKRYGVR
ncbi:MAG TPA: sigma-54 dependent transcriptional regulator [Polyangiales bacterium]|nr:sigma-54 dependent transcriptional regulator [Polyangiales bacterium]